MVMENITNSLSNNDNEVINLIRTNRNRRYTNDSANSVKQDTSNIDTTRVDSREIGDIKIQDKGSSEQERRDNGKDSSTEEKVDNKSLPTVDDIDDVEIDTDPLSSTRSTKEENFKNIRNALKASRTRVSELETELASKEESLSKLDSVAELEAKLAEANSKLEKLQKYEDVIGLYGTDGFKEKYYDSVENYKKKALSIAEDYGVESEVIDKAMDINNQKELNEFLGQYFDVYSVQDVRREIQKAQQVIIDREEAEKNPSEARDLLLTNATKLKEAANKQAIEDVKAASMSAWTEMSEAYSNKTSGIELLQEKKGNSEHNEIRQSILNTASSDFGKTVAVLANNGLKSLPIKVARAIAARYQLGEVAAHAIVQSEGLKKENKELRDELKKFTNYQRPLTNSGSSKVNISSSKEELKGKDLVRHLYESASSKL